MPPFPFSSVLFFLHFSLGERCNYFIFHLKGRGPQDYSLLNLGCNNTYSREVVMRVNIKIRNGDSHFLKNFENVHFLKIIST
jgi:hypothetical protein